jgi:hypothetical protein
MSDYRIEKTRRRITVTLAGGKRMEGDVFLQPSVRYRLGPEAPLELLNDTDPFFPLAVVDDAPLMIAKDRVVRVEYTTVADDTPPERLATGVELQFVLSDGTTIEGVVYLEVRAERARVLDFFNTYDGRFLPITRGEVTSLIHRGAIVSVKERS